MSQHDLTIANASRTAVRNDLQDALQALGTCMKGSSAPATPYAGLLWLDDDTPSSTVWTLKRYDGTDWITVSYIDTVANTEVPASSVTVAGALGFLSGWLWSNNGSDPSHDIDIAAGRGVDTTGVALIQGGAMTKRYDASWTAGNGNGGRTGSAADGGWWIHAVLDVDDQLVDYIFSQSRTAPTLPSGYSLFVPIGWFQVSSGNVVACHVYALPGGGVEVARDAPVTDFTESGTVGTTRILKALDCVPSGISVVVNLSVEYSSSTVPLDICCPDQASAGAGYGTGLGIAGTAVTMSSGGGFVQAIQAKFPRRARTNTSREIALRAATNGQTVRAAVESFEWSR